MQEWWIDYMRMLNNVEHKNKKLNKNIYKIKIRHQTKNIM